MYNPDKHHRHSVRLRNYNYANIGAYFVTVCLNERITEIGRDFHKGQNDFNMVLNDCGKMVSNEYIENVKTNNWIPFNNRLWQRNFWEHIIRDEQSYKDISQYIIDNPANWGKDELYV